MIIEIIDERIVEGSSGDNPTDLPPANEDGGLWLLISLGLYLLLMLLIVLYCLNRRQKTDFSCLPEGLCTGGNCACLSACNCEGTLPGLSDCCPARNPNEPSCFDSLQCNCDTDQPDPDPCCESGFMLGDCCKCQPSEEEIIQRRLENDPDYFIKMMQNNPQFQRSLREQNAMGQFQQNQNLATTQPTSIFSSGSLTNQPTWSTINASTGQSMRLQTLSTDASYT